MIKYLIILFQFRRLVNNSSNLNYISTSERISSSISSFGNIPTISPINSFAFSLEVGELSREFLTFCSRFFSSVDRFFSLPVAQAEDDDFSFKNAAKEVGHVLGDNYRRFKTQVQQTN